MAEPPHRGSRHEDRSLRSNTPTRSFMANDLRRIDTWRRSCLCSPSRVAAPLPCDQASLHSILDLSQPHGRLGSPGPSRLHHYMGAAFIVGRVQMALGHAKDRAPPARRADHLAYACNMAITNCNTRVRDWCIVCAVSIATADVTGWCWLLILSRRPGNTTRS